MILRDLIAAHRRSILAAIGILLVQFVDSETADWVIGAVDVLLIYAIKNDSDAVDRIYRKR